MTTTYDGRFDKNGPESIIGPGTVVDPNTGTVTVWDVIQRELSEYFRNPNTLREGNYLIRRPYESKGGRIFGIEAAWQQTFDSLPKPLDGLGVITNYTYVHSTSNTKDPQTGRTLPIPGQSSHSLNLVSFFEHGPFGVRLAYNYRTRYFEGMDRAGARFVADFGQLDGNMSLQLHDNLGLFVEALNLTNTIMKRYVAYEYRPYQHMTTGRRFFAGVRGRL